MNGAVRPAGDGVVVRVRLTPAGGVDRVDGPWTDAAGVAHVRARVRAAASDGAANAALIALIAQTLGVAKGAVRIVRGHAARVKELSVAGVSAPEAAAAFGVEP